jgi:hypothetical protein
VPARLLLTAFPLLQQHPDQTTILEALAAAAGDLDQALIYPLETALTAFVP